MFGSKISSLVSKATQDDRQPPSGFQLTELAQLTIQSDDDCQVLQDALLKRLGKDRPYVKYKTLRVIKYISENGRPEFRMGMQKHAEQIRRCTQFKGKIDPLYGMTPSEDVRKAAKAAIAAIFASGVKDTSKIRNRITGFASNQEFGSTGSSQPDGIYSAPTVAVGASGKSMQGFGNTNYEPDTGNSSSTWRSTFGSYFNKSEASKPNFQPHKPAPTYTGINPSVLSQVSNSQRHALDSSNLRGDKPRQRGQVGGTWGSNGAEEVVIPKPMSSAFTSQIKQPQASGPAMKSESTGEYESTLVTRLVSAGGMKPEPSREDLEKFYRQYPTLAQDAVHDVLEETLFTGSVIQKLRCMHVIEGILKREFSGEMQAFFKAHPDSLQALTNHNKKNVRAKVAQVMKLVGIGAGSNIQSPTTQSEDNEVIVIQSNEPNLLDWGVQNVEATTPPESKAEPSLLDMLGVPAAEPPKAQETTGLFNGLTSEPPKSKELSVDNWLEPSQTKAKPEEKREPASFDPFDFMSEQGQPKSKGVQDSGFGFMNTTSQTTTTTSAFANLGIGSGTANSGPPASQSSGFESLLGPAPQTNNTNAFGLSTAPPTSNASAFGLGAAPPTSNASGFGSLLGQGPSVPPQSSGFGSLLNSSNPPAQQNNTGLNMTGFLPSTKKPSPTGFGISSGASQPFGFKPVHNGFGMNTVTPQPMNARSGFSTNYSGSVPQSSNSSPASKNDPFGSLLNPKQPSVVKATLPPKGAKAQDPFKNLLNWS